MNWEQMSRSERRFLFTGHRLYFYGRTTSVPTVMDNLIRQVYIKPDVMFKSAFAPKQIADISLLRTAVAYFNYFLQNMTFGLF